MKYDVLLSIDTYYAYACGIKMIVHLFSMVLLEARYCLRY